MLTFEQQRLRDACGISSRNNVLTEAEYLELIQCRCPDEYHEFAAACRQIGAVAPTEDHYYRIVEDNSLF